MRAHQHLGPSAHTHGAEEETGLRTPFASVPCCAGATMRSQVPASSSGGYRVPCQLPLLLIYPGEQLVHGKAWSSVASAQYLGQAWVLPIPSDKCVYEESREGGEMLMWVMALNLIPRIHFGEGENQLPQVASEPCPPPTHTQMNVIRFWQKVTRRPQT